MCDKISTDATCDLVQNGGMFPDDIDGLGIQLEVQIGDIGSVRCRGIIAEVGVILLPDITLKSIGGLQAARAAQIGITAGLE